MNPGYIHTKLQESTFVRALALITQRMNDQKLRKLPFGLALLAFELNKEGYSPNYEKDIFFAAASNTDQHTIVGILRQFLHLHDRSEQATCSKQAMRGSIDLAMKSIVEFGEYAAKHPIAPNARHDIEEAAYALHRVMDDVLEPVRDRQRAKAKVASS